MGDFVNHCVDQVSRACSSFLADLIGQELCCCFATQKFHMGTTSNTKHFLNFTAGDAARLVAC